MFCIYFGEKRKQRLDGGPGLIAQFSKCDFLNLWDFLSRNMWSKFFSSTNFWSKKISTENRKICFETKKKSGKINEKVNEKWKFRNFGFFRFFLEISKCSFFIDFFIYFPPDFFCLKNIFRSSSDFFFISKK